MVKAALEGTLKNSSFVEHPIFKVLMPTECPGVPSELLNPKNTWEDKEGYDVKALELAEKFSENFKKFNNVPDNIVKAGPEVKAINVKNI
jgi:phosphoenolpyruvate carboxykinase (ATP)